jgi:DNA gyrase/topoisomerase IV subunit B
VNGVGAGITLYTSTYMKVTSVDMDGNRGVFEYKNESGDKADEAEIENIKHTEDKAPKSVSHGVTVMFKPDLAFFNVDRIDETQKALIYTRLINLAFTHPQIEFYFDGKLVKARDFNSFLKFYSPNSTPLYEDEKMNIAVFPSEEGYKSIHYANGLNLSDGGSINDYITNNIVTKFTERLQRGYAKITNSTVKPKLGFVIILKGMVNLRFTSQSKTKLSNTYTELKLPTLNYVEFAEKLFKSSAIKDPIMELYKLQQELENRKAHSGLKADKKEIFNPKHLKATKDAEFLMIAEGDSALSSLPAVFGRENIGYVPLTGKLVNSLKSKPAQIKSNPRVSDIIEAYGMGLEESRYKKLIIATDADLDGSHITALIISLFYVLQPQDLYDGKLFKLNTPVMAITDKNDKLIKWYYSLGEYNKDKSSIKSSYNCIHKKGLGSWTSEDLEVIIQKDKLENMIEQIIVTPEDNQTIENWMKDEGVQFRQDTLRNKAFSIENI